MSYNYLGSTDEIKDLIINKLGGLWEKLDNFKNSLTNYFPVKAIEKIINIIFYITKNFNIETIFKKPKKVFANILIEYKSDILDNSKKIYANIISFINENFIILKDFIIPFINNMLDALFNNIEFIANLNFGNFKEYFTSTKNIIFNTISESYEGIKNSENTHNIIENAKYSANKIKEVSGEYLNKGINKIKDISKSETVKNIKSSCEDAANYIGNTLKGFFS